VDRGLAELDAQIARLRELPSLAREAAPDAAHAVERVIERQIQAATDPAGKAWEPTQDGRTPLRTADKALAVVAIGPTVFARLKGHIARHHLGRARGGVQRQILPTQGLPSAMSTAIRGVLVEHFERKMGGR
jgi:hypothetical protein